MLKRILAVAGIIVVIGGIITANIYRSRQPRGLPVKVAAVEERDMTTTVLTSGRAELAVEQEVTATVAGRVVSVLVQPGDRVEKGQTLVRLEATDLTAKVREAEAAVAVARANLDKGRAGAGPEEITAAQIALEQVVVVK